MIILFRLVAYALAAAISYATLGPPGLRPHSNLGQNGEHALAFGLLGLAFALGYPRHRLPAAILTAIFAVYSSCCSCSLLAATHHVGGVVAAWRSPARDLRRALFWIGVFVVLLIAGAILEPYLSQAILPEILIRLFFVLNIGAVISITFGLLYYFVGRRNFFQQHAEMLLLNILPKEISEALKAGPRTVADQCAAASILFADVVEFTPMAAKMTPLQLVDLLNEVFQCFDDLAEKYNLEKIKTIGDCYMVASGLPPETGSRDRARQSRAWHAKLQSRNAGLVASS